MQAVKEIEITYQDIFNRAMLLLNRSEKARKEQIVANFQLGQLVAEIQDSARYGDSAVVKLAEDLTRAKGYQVHASFLWECARVYRTFRGNLQRIWELERELQLRGIHISWRFLVRNCTPVPEPEKVLEAEAYWERQITEWENSIHEVEENIEKRDELIEKMPPRAREQFEGFVVKLAQDKTLKVTSDNFKKFNEVLQRIEKLLDGLLSENKIDFDEKAIDLLKKIKEKIEILIGYKC
ncbi:hypothetical protein QI155_05980 [Thermodesulfovibrio sp. 1176]|uniref:hypothetical protein n=1 Tax=Thermodesulfovibrio sp. 1176 TaxID=3043424 RepID=UPI002482D5C1|nr:hypothetical protein [Thermodesulfovibrio sp. 1176]MDI1472083.1 hypothetical protein [Thermodesulfovibrio sp. 1176]